MIFVALLAAGPARCLPVPLIEPAAAYGVPATPWKVELGHHRARVTVAQAAPVVLAHLPWRVQFGGMPDHRVLVFSAAGREVSNVVRATATRLAGDILFEASAPGDYYIYYLPLRPAAGMNDPADYLPYVCTADAGWRQRHGLTDEALPAGGWRRFPAAMLAGFEARTELDRFDPMAVIASPGETAALLGNEAPPMLLFPEDRSRPIRMKRDLPLRWIETGPSAVFRGQAQQHEYYAFQIGVFAPKQALGRLQVRFSDLRGPGAESIPSAALTCFNLGGIDSRGRPFVKSLDVPAGGIQALWCGVDVREDQPPGVYQGTATVAAEDTAPREIAIQLEVKPGPIPERGDHEPWRHSRLRWLNSTAGTGDTIPEPYTPLQIEGATVRCLGRTVTLDGSGLPAMIASGPNPALARPIRFTVETAEGPGSFRPEPLQWVSRSPARVAWKCRGTAANATLECAGDLEYDGHLTYRIDLTAIGDLDLRDARLEIPMRPEAAPYVLGAGHPGGTRPRDFAWSWQGPFNSFWVGSADVGVHCKLLGGSYTGPMLNLYHPAPPAAWHNGGKGGVTVRDRDGAVLATAFGGARRVPAGTTITFAFSLLVTPVKPLDVRTQLATRYYHNGDNWLPDGRGNDPEPPAEALAAGVNVVNLHHASIYNPYINYPFLRSRELKDFTTRMHARGVKVKVYDTVRELTNMVTEIWALRSLGDEVYADGGGGGYAWCREHLVTGYQPAWFQRFGDSPPDAAMVTSGDSRWYNYYIEGIGWLARNTGIDGLYLDDVSYDRRILQRVRAVMAGVRPGCLIDLHSNTGFSIGAANHYLEFLPYIDRPWFGESFNYQAMTPDQWLVQVSGIPFGLVGEMLHEGGNPWRGAVYGMTNRLGWQTNGHHCDPRPVWRIWDRFGLRDATMTGYWQPGCPVTTDHPGVKATVYHKQGRAMIALASWEPAAVAVRLAIDWRALGIRPAKAVLHAPAARGFQRAARWRPDDPIPVAPGRGWLVFVDETGPRPGDTEPDAMDGRRILLDERFGQPLPAAWKRALSKQPGTTISVADGALTVAAAANVSALVERELPPGVAAVACVVNRGTDPGETWGAGMGLWWPDGRAVRVNLRGPEGRFGIDVTGAAQRFAGRFAPGAVTLRLRLEATRIIVEAMNPDDDWQTLATLPRQGFQGDPKLVRIGKMAGVEGTCDHTTPGRPGGFTVHSVTCYGAP